MKNNWNTTLPPHSELLLCKVKWELEIFPVVAYYTGSEWLEANKKPVKGDVIGWQIIEL